MPAGSYILTTVLAAPASIALTTLSRVRRELDVDGGKDNALLGDLIAEASGVIADYCNRAFGLGTYQDVIRLDRAYRMGALASGDHNPVAVTKWPPVTPLARVVENDVANPLTLVEGADFEVDYAAGLLYRLDAAGQPRDWRPVGLTVEYQAGYALPGQPGQSGVAPLPPAIEAVALAYITARWFSRGRDPFLRQESVAGVGDAQYWIPTAGTGDLTPDMQSKLAPYRVPVAG